MLGLIGCARPGGVAPASSLEIARSWLEAGRYADARDAFRQALAERPGDLRARLGLGAAFEGLRQLDSAAIVYTALGRERLPAYLRRHLDGRLRLIARARLLEAAREAVAEEDQLTREAPRPNAVAVFPFLFLGADTTLRPLGRGLALILVTDLGRIQALTLLERDHVQLLLAELRLDESGLVDLSTAARSGRLLHAAQVVQGSVQQVPGTERLRVEASVVSTSTAEIAATGSADDRLQQLFDVEKAVLFQLIERLGIPLTLAERERLMERPTASLQAFLAFSRGLAAEDRADFHGAAGAYGAAAAAEPRFVQARERAAAAAGMAEAADASLGEVARLADGTPEDNAFLADILEDVVPSGVGPHYWPRDPPGSRDPLSDVGGRDRVEPPSGRNGVIIRVRRP